MTEDLQQHMSHIAQAVEQGHYRFTVHGAQRLIARGIERQELEAAIARGRIIEHYPEHYYGPCSLVFGRTPTGRALHILCSLRRTVDIVTLYEPNPIEWEADLQTRRKAQ